MSIERREAALLCANLLPFLVVQEVCHPGGRPLPGEMEGLPTWLGHERGSSLGLELAAQEDPQIVPFTHTDRHDRIRTGTHTIYTGGSRNSHPLLPSIPARP